MKNKEKKRPSNGSVSELILSAVYFLQKKNGVTAKDITKYICHKRGFKQSHMKNKVREALDRGTKNGIFNLKRGLYKVGEDCRKKLTILKKKVKKKTEANKIPKRIIQNKISMEKSATEEKKLTPINECPKKSLVFRDRMGSHKMSEDIFDRRGRENSYFEPSMLARPSDEEYDDYDDEEDDDNEDDENSEIDENRNPDIFTFTFSDDLSQERFPELNIYSVAKEVKQKKMCSKGKKRKKSSSRGKGKKTKTSKARKKKCSEEDKKKSKRMKCSINNDGEADDEDDQDNHDCNNDEEDDDDDYLDEEDESDYSAETDIEKTKESKFIVRPKVKKSEKKEKTESESVRKSKSKKEIKEIKEYKETKDNKVNQKKKEKQEQVKKTRKHKKSKRESSEENTTDETRDKLVAKSEKSLTKSNCLITSSTKLLPSDFKLSISPNKMVSDVKFSTTNTKFESQDSLTLLLSGKMKNEATEQSLKEKELFDDFEIFCDCQPPKRKSLPNSYDLSLTNSTEPIQKRIRSKRSQK